MQYRHVSKTQLKTLKLVYCLVQNGSKQLKLKTSFVVQVLNSKLGIT